MTQQSPAQGLKGYLNLSAVPAGQGVPQDIYDRFSAAEGGWTDDTGGLTYGGVSESAGFTRAQIQALNDQKVRNYWDNVYSNEISHIKDPTAQEIALHSRATSGPSVYAKQLQRAMNSVAPTPDQGKPDGVFGSGTLSRLTAIQDHKPLAGAMLKQFEDHTASLGKGEEHEDYADGWKNRTDKLRALLETQRNQAIPESFAAQSAPAPVKQQVPLLVKGKRPATLVKGKPPTDTASSTPAAPTLPDSFVGPPAPKGLGKSSSTPPPEVLEKQAHSASKGCLILQLPDSMRKKIREWKKENVPAAQIVEDEDDFHTTVLYGLKEEVTKKDILKHLKPGPVDIELGKLKVFEADDRRPESDALVLEVTSPALTKLHKKIKKAFNVESNYPDYNPHVTIAYVEPGSLKALYKDGDIPFPDATLSCEEMVFSTGSSDARKLEKISLTASDDPKKHVMTYCCGCKKESTCRCKKSQHTTEIVNQCHMCAQQEKSARPVRRRAPVRPRRQGRSEGIDWGGMAAAAANYAKRIGSGMMEDLVIPAGKSFSDPGHVFTDPEFDTRRKLPAPQSPVKPVTPQPLPPLVKNSGARDKELPTSGMTPADVFKAVMIKSARASIDNLHNDIMSGKDDRSWWQRQGGAEGLFNAGMGKAYNTFSSPTNLLDTATKPGQFVARELWGRPMAWAGEGLGNLASGGANAWADKGYHWNKFTTGKADPKLRQSQDYAPMTNMPSQFEEGSFAKGTSERLFGGHDNKMLNAWKPFLNIASGNKPHSSIAGRDYNDVMRETNKPIDRGNNSPNKTLGNTPATAPAPAWGGREPDVVSDAWKQANFQSLTNNWHGVADKDKWDQRAENFKEMGTFGVYGLKRHLATALRNPSELPADAVTLGSMAGDKFTRSAGHIAPWLKPVGGLLDGTIGNLYNNVKFLISGKDPRTASK